MKSTLNESERADLRRVLAQMESSAPLAPDLETAVAVTDNAGNRSTAVNSLVGIAVVTALILPAALFWGDSPAEEPDRIPVGAEPPAEPSTTVTSAVETAVWASTELPNFVEALTVHRGRFYAVSAEEVLVSDDGDEWEVAGHLPPRSHLGQLVSHGDLLVANGSEITEDAAGGKLSTPKIWASADDGKTWSVAMAGEHVVTVVSTPTGLVAPGLIDLEPVGDQLPRKAAVWTSDNGYDWTLAWEAEADLTFSSLATNAIWDDGLVIIGRQGPANYSEGSGKSGPEWDKVVWTGPTASELSASGSTNILGHLADLTQSGHGIFGLTYSVDPSVKDSSAVWRSDDGTHWTAVAVGPGWYHNSVTTDGSTIVIGGDTLGYAPKPEMRIWYTVDGNTWTEFDTSGIPKGLRVKSVELDDRVLVVALYSNEKVGGHLFSRPFEP